MLFSLYLVRLTLSPRLLVDCVITLLYVSSCPPITQTWDCVPESDLRGICKTTEMKHAVGRNLTLYGRLRP
ncbi:hypothetical protein V8B97DRAFT_1941525 [Scleroderma yunnanense]